MNQECAGVNSTYEEQNKSGKLEARYYKESVKYAGKGLLDEVDDDLEYIERLAEEILNEFLKRKVICI